ncbi:siderophore-interacting protein [Rhizobium leguminosarum]|uniref:NADPH-dependent ferric siderophore reductase n=1 Tax=Rhizobium leguminosarum TaxID=384 RepID=A0A1B1C8N9_RHILE|nr:siderophore-interacting protein [Rhizobium leguminosarum]ANP86107.1 NADPH-dependent ferric siderophore reductase [Rhizobium leguminosarum]
MDNNQFKDQASSTPGIERIRHDTRRRLLTVESVVDITPSMRRVILAGDDLADFISLGADDHIKIFIPTADGGEEHRDYTPRRYDNAERRLTIDFALHEAGPVTRWAIDARPGDRLEIGGPRGSAVVSKTVKRWLLIGDETALPAIGRRIEESGAGTVVTTIAAVIGPLEEQTFETSAELYVRWAHRPLSQATDATALLKLLSTVDIKPETFIWVAAEASVTRDIRAYLLERGCPLGWIKASGYWVFGKADTTEKFG